MSRLQCGCGRKTGQIDDGKKGTYTLECEECCKTGDYTKSSCWDHERDKAEDKKVACAMKYKAAMEGVKPLKKRKK